MLWFVECVCFVVLLSPFVVGVLCGLRCVVVVCLCCFVCVEVCCVFALSINVYGYGCCVVCFGIRLCLVRVLVLFCVVFCL